VIVLRHMNVLPISWKQGDARKAVRTWVVNVIRVMTMLWLVAHFTLTILYVCPTNPVKVRLSSLLDITIARYFYQNWNLFAPNPTSADLVLLVRPLSSNEFTIVQTKGLPSDGWYDLASPLWTKLESDRFSAYGKFGLPVNKSLGSYLNKPGQHSVQLMVKLASAFCKDIGQNNASYVALMIHKVLSKPWSDRATSVPRVVQSTLVGIYPVDRSVENVHLYQI
jgi:hypothetical protein